MAQSVSLPCHFHRYTEFVRNLGGDGIYETTELRRCYFPGCEETKAVTEKFR